MLGRGEKGQKALYLPRSLHDGKPPHDSLFCRQGVRNGFTVVPQAACAPCRGSQGVLPVLRSACLRGLCGDVQDSLSAMAEPFLSTR